MGLSLFISGFRVLHRVLLKLTFQNFMIQHAKYSTMNIIFLLYHHLHLLIELCKYYYSFKLETHDYDDHHHPSSTTLSVLPLPVHPTGNIDYYFLELEKQLPIMPYCLFLEKTGKDNDQEEECVCIVCMNCIERKHEVRMLCNCCHVFHKECLDGWIGEGKRTCPLCRSKLLLLHGGEDDHGDEVGFGGDLFRVEEMLSLFGDNFLMGH